MVKRWGKSPPQQLAIVAGVGNPCLEQPSDVIPPFRDSIDGQKINAEKLQNIRPKYLQWTESGLCTSSRSIIY